MYRKSSSLTVTKFVSNLILSLANKNGLLVGAAKNQSSARSRLPGVYVLRRSLDLFRLPVPARDLCSVYRADTSSPDERALARRSCLPTLLPGIVPPPRLCTSVALVVVSAGAVDGGAGGGCFMIFITLCS